MKYGTVRMWDENRGFGFILSDDDEDPVSYTHLRAHET